MTKFSHRKGVSMTRRKKIILVTGLLLLVAVFGSALLVRRAYQSNLQPLSSSKAGIVVTIEPGSAPGEIAEQLKQKGVIKSDWALEWYVRNNDLRDKLKAGTYLFHPSQSVPEIVDKIARGVVATDLVTILPGKRLDQVKDNLVKAGFKESEVDAALEPTQYEDMPALTDKPKGASLEGYLYPESFQKTADTSARHIIKQSLEEMQLRLTPDLRAAFNEQGLTVHQGIILASLIEKEVDNQNDKPIVAQIFLKRLRDGMLLQSDATNAYTKLNGAYDSYKHKGLPPGPISNVSASSLEAVASPAATLWVYFVSGDDGRTYFSKTLEEHEKLVKEHCKKLCN